MICHSIRVRDFRNIEEAEVSFCDGVNLLIGENAQGKTNLLEAVFYASVGRSFRAGHTAEMLRFGCPQAEIFLNFADAKRDQNLMIRLFRDRKKIAEKNGVRMERMSDIVGSFRAVLFCPEHLSLIKDGPAQRRSYMDLALSRMYPLYIKSLQRYNYLLKQRNVLLKNAVTDRKTFEVTAELWSAQLAKEAAVISAWRLKFLHRANYWVQECFSEMTGEHEKPILRYDGSAGLSEEDYEDREKTEKRYFQLLTSSCDREIAAGATLWGIHKDDIDIRLNEKSARLYASQGQQRSLALSMKLAEGEITREEFGDYPVFLFDDVLSELDAVRRNYLLCRIRDKQVIITTCEESISADFENVRKIRVKNGTYHPE